MSRAATAPNRAREYETIYILKPDIDAESAERVGSRLAEVVGRESGQLTKVETWGRRKLAYAIAKHRRGVYVYLKYLGSGRAVSEVERNLRLFDGVLKYQTVLVRSDVEAEGMAISADDVKFERLELPPLEEDKDDSRERQLGLVESERREKHDGLPPDLEEGDLEVLGEMGGDEDEES
jgi:small subunit ribosomal protein S6